MAAGTVAGVYAQALLELASERGNRVAIVESCRGLLGGPNRPATLSRGLIGQLDDPRLGKAKAKAVLNSALGSKIEMELLDLLSLLVDRNRLSDAPAILAEVVRIEDEAVGRVVVHIVTAQALSPTTLNNVVIALMRILGPGTEVQAKVDPKLIGGMTVRVGDVFIDGCIHRKLIDMKSRILDVQLPETLWSSEEP